MLGRITVSAIWRWRRCATANSSLSTWRPPDRSAVDNYAVEWAQYVELDFADQGQFRKNITAMFDVLKSQSAEIPPQVHVACRSFLHSLLYTATWSVIQFRTPYTYRRGGRSL